MSRAALVRLLGWSSLALWVVAAVLLVPLASKTSEVMSTDQINFLPRSAEATQAMERARAAFPGTDAPVAVVVYVRDSGITGSDIATVTADRSAFAALAAGGEVAPAVSSEDGRALLLAFPLPNAGGYDQAEAAVGQIKAELADAPDGLQTAVTGSAGALADVGEAASGFDTTLLLAAASVVAVLLLITYRSPFLWLVPLLCAGLASQLASAVVYLLGSHAGVTVSENSAGIMLVLVFGAGTDYALLLIARYREELRRHADRYVAMALALRRSFPAILASAATVMLGMLCLLAAQMNDMRGLGPVAAAGIFVAFAVMTTLLPALLVLLGRWVFWPFIPRYGSASAHDIGAQHRVWRRIATAVGRRPRPIWVATTLVLAALSFGVLGLQVGQPADQTYTQDVGSVVGQRLIDDHYPGGASSPAQILTAAGAADQVVAAATAVAGVAGAEPAAVSADSAWVRVEAVLADPPDSAAAKRTVDQLRETVHAVPGADALVGGETAILLDTERAAGQDNRFLMPLILVAVFGVLVLLLRALVAPLLLVASVVLSFAAAMGLAGLVFQALGYPGIMPSLPLYGFLFLVTLGVDYTIFLMTRAREEVAQAGNRDGILSALTVTGGVVTSAGLVLAGTFATLLTLPLVTALQIGLIVAVGVLLDTFVVRTLLVPALAVDIGPRVWWPSRRATLRRSSPPILELSSPIRPDRA